MSDFTHHLAVQHNDGPCDCRYIDKVEKLEGALKSIMDNLGVPQPVAHAYEIAKEALASLKVPK